MNMKKVGVSRNWNPSYQKIQQPEIPQALPDHDAEGKRGPLHQISQWMVSLGAVCVPKLQPRIVTCMCSPGAQVRSSLASERIHRACPPAQYMTGSASWVRGPWTQGGQKSLRDLEFRL